MFKKFLFGTVVAIACQNLTPTWAADQNTVREIYVVRTTDSKSWALQFRNDENWTTLEKRAQEYFESDGILILCGKRPPNATFPTEWYNSNLEKLSFRPNPSGLAAAALEAAPLPTAPLAVAPLPISPLPTVPLAAAAIAAASLPTIPSSQDLIAIGDLLLLDGKEIKSSWYYSFSSIKRVMDRNDWDAARTRFDFLSDDAKRDPMAIDIKNIIDQN